MKKQNIKELLVDEYVDFPEKDQMELDVIRDNCTIEEGECGPGNKEASDLMDAFTSSVMFTDNARSSHLDEDDEEDFPSGVGKDIYGKYAFCEILYQGKTYQIHFREKSHYEYSVEATQSRLIGPKLKLNTKRLN